MDLYNSLCLKTKLATLFFILGKLTFFPSVYFLFSSKIDIALNCIILYSLFIFLSLTLSILSLRNKNTNINLVSKKLKDSCKEEKTILVKIKDGKIIEVV